MLLLAPHHLQHQQQLPVSCSGKLKAKQNHTKQLTEHEGRHPRLFVTFPTLSFTLTPRCLFSQWTVHFPHPSICLHCPKCSRSFPEVVLLPFKESPSPSAACLSVMHLGSPPAISSLYLATYCAPLIARLCWHPAHDFYRCKHSAYAIWPNPAKCGLLKAIFNLSAVKGDSTTAANPCSSQQ